MIIALMLILMLLLTIMRILTTITNDHDNTDSGGLGRVRDPLVREAEQGVHASCAM